MKLYLINLDRAEDRRTYMLDELNRVAPEFPMERARCVDIKAPRWAPPSCYKPGKWRSDRWSLRPSDIEIFNSHIDCWKKIAASGGPGVVLEDDLLFSNSFGHAIKALLCIDLPGIVRLDGVAKPIIFGPAIKQDEQFQFSEICSLTASSAAYMLDSDTATALANSARIERTVDDFLFDPCPEDRGARGHGLGIFQLEPVVCLQAQFGGFADKSRNIPPFLRATKRIDNAITKDREYRGPMIYRIHKELLRARSRYRFSEKVNKAVRVGGHQGIPQLSADLSWS